MPTKKQVSAPIRMSPELLEKVAEASRKTGLSQADILRLCLAIGLEDLARVNYDIARVISEAAQSPASMPTLKVAEGKPSSLSTLAPGAEKPTKYPRKSG